MATYSVQAVLSVFVGDGSKDVDVVAHFDADLPNDRCAWVTLADDPTSRVYLPGTYRGTLYLPTPGQAALEADADLRTALGELGWSVL